MCDKKSTGTAESEASFRIFDGNRNPKKSLTLFLMSIVTAESNEQKKSVLQRNYLFLDFIV